MAQQLCWFKTVEECLPEVSTSIERTNIQRQTSTEQANFQLAGWQKEDQYDDTQRDANKGTAAEGEHNRCQEDEDQYRYTQALETAQCECAVDRRWNYDGKK